MHLSFFIRAIFPGRFKTGFVKGVYDNKMFVAAKRIKKIHIIVAVVALLLIFTAFRLFVCTDGTMTTAVSSIGQYQLAAGTNEERIDFLSQFGWEVENEPVSLETVNIPQNFNRVYNRYNEIQLEQGLNLLDYAGKECKRVSYRVTNYPESDGTVNANLLIYEGRVVGGDISSTELNGFMHGFVLEGMIEEVKGGET